eukprot:g40073.t1
MLDCVTPFCAFHERVRTIIKRRNPQKLTMLPLFCLAATVVVVQAITAGDACTTDANCATLGLCVVFGQNICVCSAVGDRKCCSLDSVCQTAGWNSFANTMWSSIASTAVEYQIDFGAMLTIDDNFTKADFNFTFGSSGSTSGEAVMQVKEKLGVLCNQLQVAASTTATVVLNAAAELQTTLLDLAASAKTRIEAKYNNASATFKRIKGDASTEVTVSGPGTVSCTSASFGKLTLLDSTFSFSSDFSVSHSSMDGATVKVEADILASGGTKPDYGQIEKLRNAVIKIVVDATAWKQLQAGAVVVIGDATYSSSVTVENSQVVVVGKNGAEIRTFTFVAVSSSSGRRRLLGDPDCGQASVSQDGKMKINTCSTSGVAQLRPSLVALLALPLFATAGSMLA